MDSFEGGCVCGAARYRMSGRPLIVHCCHCQQCQKTSGGAFAVNAVAEQDRVALISGATVAVQRPTESGKGQVMHQCAACGVALWSQYLLAGEAVVFVRVGTLDMPSQMPPDIHIYMRSKQPWVQIPEGAKAFEAYYRPSEHWPPESLERLRRAKIASP